MKYLMIIVAVFTVVLAGMKLAGAVACTWLMVFLPMIVALGIWLVFLLFALAIIGICALIAIMTNDN